MIVIRFTNLTKADYENIKKLSSSFLLSFCIVINVLFSKVCFAQSESFSFDSSINIQGDGGETPGIVADVLLAGDYFVVHSHDGIKVFNTANNELVSSFPFSNETQRSKFAPYPFNPRTYVGDFNLMTYSPLTNQVFIVSPDLIIYCLQLGNDMQMESVFNMGNISEFDHLKPLHGLNIIKFDTTENLLYWTVSGAQEGQAIGNFHERESVVLLLKYHADGGNGGLGTLTLIYNEIFRYTDSSEYYKTVHDVEYFTEPNTNRKYFFICLKKYIRPYEILQNSSGDYSIELLADVYDANTDHSPYKFSKLLKITDNEGGYAINRLIALPYYLGVSQEVIDSNYVNLYSINLIPTYDEENKPIFELETKFSPSRRVIDAIYNSETHDLIMCYAHDRYVSNPTIESNLSQLPGNDVCVYRFNADGSFNDQFALEIVTNFEPDTDLYSSLDMNYPLRFVNGSNNSIRLNKRHTIVDLAYTNNNYIPNLVNRSYGAEFGAAFYSNNSYYVASQFLSGLLKIDGDEAALLQTGYPAYNITGVPQLKKMYIWNKLLVDGAGVYKVDYTTGNFILSNLNEDIDGLTHSPIGDIIYNPLLNHSLISLYNPDAAVIKVIDEDTGEILPDLVIPGTAYPDKMFITNDRLYVATATKDDIGELNPAPVMYSCEISSEGYGVFESVLTVPSFVGLVNNDYPVYTIDFSLDEESGIIYCLVAVNNTTYPRGEPGETGYLNIGFSTLAPYHSMANTSNVNIINPNALPFKVFAIDGTNAVEVPFNYFPILYNARSIKVLTNASGDKRYLVINANKLWVKSLTDNNSEFTSEFSLNSFTYDPITNQIFGFADLPANDNHAARSTTIYSKNLNDLSQNFSLDEVFTYAGQAAAIFYNPFDMKVYFQTKMDATRRGQDPMKLYQINPIDLQESAPVSLEEYGYFVELDECEDLHFYNYNLVQSFIDPYLNKIFLPLGGHSKLAVVNFEPLEAIALKPGTINWVSFPRLEREGNGVVISETLFNTIIPDLSDEFIARHNEGGLIINKTFQNNEWSGNLNFVRSSLGYKISTKHLSQAYIPMTGTVLAPNTDVNINPFYENWLGYFLYQPQKPWEAFPPDALSKLSFIKGKYWSCTKNNGTNPTKSSVEPYWLCACNQTGGIWLNYGDMVAVYPEAREEFSFQWQQVPGQKTESTYQPPEYFSFREGFDYTPLFIEPDSSGTIQEIGAFAGDSCIGAAVVNPGDSLVLVRAFVPPGSQDSISLQLYNGMKSGNRVVRQYYVTAPGQEEPHYRSINTRERKPWYLISLKGKPDETMAVNTVFSFVTYPNPTEGKISLRVSAPEASAWGSLLLLDTQGRIVSLQSTGPVNKGDNELNVILKNPWTAIPAGLYQLVLRTSFGTATQKLIIH